MVRYAQVEIELGGGGFWEEWCVNHEGATMEPIGDHRRAHFEDWMVNLRGEDSWLSSERSADWFTGKVILC